METLGTSLDSAATKTVANVTFLEEVEKRMRGKDVGLGIQHMDRVLRIVHCRIMHGEKEDVTDFQNIAMDTLGINGGAPQLMDQLLKIAGAMHLPGNDGLDA